MPSATVSAAIFVLVIDLSVGQLRLTDGPSAIPRAVIAVESFGEIAGNSASATLLADALSPAARREFWINRPVAIYEIEPGEIALTSSRQVFRGLIAAEPADDDGRLSLQLTTPEQLEHLLPAVSPIDLARYPQAPSESLGQIPPTIWGEVEAAPLLPVSAQPFTMLAQTAGAGDNSLSVDDATALPTAGSLWLDGLAYDYSSRADNALYGLTPPARREHRQGTLVALSGDTVYLAAGHELTDIDQVKADGTLLAGTADTAAATVTLSGPPALSARGERMTLQAHFDEVMPATNASNPANAIRAALGSHNQSATSLPTGITAATDPVAEIVFSRPPDGYRIIGGAYTIGFSVVPGAQVGRAEVSIGGQVVYVYEPGTGPLYAHNPAALQIDDDIDRLPVAIRVADGGNAALAVSITSATRLVVTGNIDEANYATIAPGKLIQVKQTDVFAERGPIARVQLLARWFATAAALGTATVKVNGAAVGGLKQTQLSDASLSKTITVDVTSQGNASLPQLDVSTSVAGGTASLSHLSQAMQAVVPAALQSYKTGANLYYWRGWSLAPTLHGWESGLGAISVDFVFSMDTDIALSDLVLDECAVDLQRADGSTILSVAATTGATSIATGTWKRTVTMNELPSKIYWRASNVGSQTLRAKPVSVNFSWNGKLTNGAISQNNTPASGSSGPISGRNLSHAGTSVAVNNGSISFVVPAPPRVVDTLIPLPSIRQWADLTNLTAEVSLSGGTPSVALVEISLLVEYDAQIYEAAAGPVTARVIASTGNPADIIAELAAATGTVLEVGSKRRFAAWCDAFNYRYARRLAESADALSLLTYALANAHVELIPGAEGHRLVRWFDLSARPVRIDEADLIEPAGMRWAERVENAIALNYRESYAADGFKAALVADPDNNDYCRRSLREIRRRVPVTVEAQWIRDDATAARYLADYARRFAPMRRVIDLQLPFIYRLSEGDLLRFRRHFYRVTDCSTDNGWISCAAEQIID